MNLPKSKRTLILIAVGILFAGWILGKLSRNDHGGGSPDASGVSVWTCSMHPQVQLPKPGKCPICAMNLIPLNKGKSNSSRPRELVLTEAAKQLAKIRTAPVERRFVEAEVSLVGKVAFDETKTRTMAARFPGRIERLYVDYTGVDVRKGDHLANIYSPELLTAQQELLSAIKFGSNVETSRDKLRLWDLSEERIKAIEELGRTSDRMDIDALLGGIVITKHVNEGDYVKTGQPLFTIADLSAVWIQLDAYESDIPWLRFGQRVEFAAEAVPGHPFEGTIAFIAPTLDPKTRTIHVRVNADNPQLLLKPEMFVHARVFPKLAAEGKVIAPEFSDKWISPMHPEIVRDEPGKCPVCGMALVKAEDLGYAILDEGAAPPLVVPTSAVLRTGKRSVVYVELVGAKEPTYEGREILIGPRAGDHYIIEEGLMEGELVVVQGNFKLDSALQIVAKPSMMNPDGGGGGGGHDHGGGGRKVGHAGMVMYDVAPVFHEMLGGLFEAYLSTQKALAGDSLEDTKAGGAALVTALGKVDMAVVQGDAHMAWMNYLAPIRGSGAMIAEAKNLDEARIGFLPLSKTMINLTRTFQANPGDNAVEVHCPMAFDNQGGSWLQLGEEVRNPYFGAKMLSCGDVKSALTEMVKSYEVDQAFRERLGALLLDYFRLSKALAADDFELAKKEAGAARENFQKIDMSALTGDAHMAWMDQNAPLTKSLDVMFAAEEIDALRTEFGALSAAMMAAVKAFHPLGPDHVYELYCPMAFDNQGGSWLQDNEAVLNPYFGAEMLNCGSVKKELMTNTEKSPTGEHQHGRP
ncbi:MAG: Cu(I)/Ag(I) efflux system membrane fusion protein [Verrucomicrobiales bacterium]|jgi:Cu(I)/Ag(I) efflux system membrane fusion protein